MRREKSKRKKKQKKKMSSVNVAMRLNLETSIQIEARILRQQHNTHFGRTVAFIYMFENSNESYWFLFLHIYIVFGHLCVVTEHQNPESASYVIRVVFEAYLGTQTEWNSP